MQLPCTDRLTVPDVLFRLTHHFAELEGRSLGDRGWQRELILEAVQKINFSLSRSGVVLRPSGIFATTRSRHRVENPRRLYFDRPFLIYVKKRRPDAQPFFVMWVDNAEVLKPHNDSRWTPGRPAFRPRLS